MWRSPKLKLAPHTNFSFNFKLDFLLWRPVFGPSREEVDTYLRMWKIHFTNFYDHRVIAVSDNYISVSLITDNKIGYRFTEILQLENICNFIWKKFRTSRRVSQERSCFSIQGYSFPIPSDEKPVLLQKFEYLLLC